MTRSTLTQQRLDPLGALSAWPLAPAIAAILTGYALTTTAVQADQVQYPVSAALAIVLVAAASVVLVVASRPRYAPFRFGAHAAIAALAIGAYLLEQAGRWGHNARVQDDFGPIAIGLLLMTLAPYRPWREIAASAGTLGAVVAAVTLVQAPFHAARVAPVVFVAIAVAQVLAPALAGAAYSRRIVGLLLAWQTDARRAIVERTEETRARLVRGVIEQQRAELDAGVLPLLTGVLERGEITKADVTRAGALAAGVRKALVRELDKTWLDATMARERARLVERGLEPLLVVADPDRRAASFSTDQRAATAALLGALCAARGFDPCSLVVQITDASDSRDARWALAERLITPVAASLRTGAIRTVSAAAAAAAAARSQAGAPAPAPAAVHAPVAHAPGDAVKPAPAVPVFVAPPLSTAPLRTIRAATMPIWTVPDRGPRVAAEAGAAASVVRVDNVTIQVGLDLSNRQLHRLLRPYLGVLHIVFGRVQLSIRRPAGRRPIVMLEFDTGQRPGDAPLT